jgi:hypothetical protein
MKEMIIRIKVQLIKKKNKEKVNKKYISNRTLWGEEGRQINW